ncbi:BglG family transcription antiterminator [Microbacterium hydrocarbonoxydans]|uniref:BglG family transcription antiterminator n=1 Tax=Microbacterium hydrocarbonoxydans TaxID=273678 RepID=UPI002041CBFF|nr:PRD domain-containing protein [Microbacterium hydrocarbonoxydans]MCM3780228.1 PRD domain-containing protein [Microbacterium hydrocarbonoxydans]
MSRQRQDQLLTTLLRQASWATAASLADQLGVTPRSVRSYVSSVNARTTGADAIESGPAGYRAGPAARDALRARQAGESAPRDRLHSLIRALLDDPSGIDVFAMAERLHVSEATVESDLARVRGLLDDTDLALERDREVVRLRGNEAAQRRLLSRLAHDEMDAASFHPETFRRALAGSAVSAQAVAPFKSELVRELGALGYFVNELAISDVLLHIAIAADRVASGHALESASTGARPEIPEVGAIIARLAQEHFAVTLGEGDSGHLASLVLTRIVAPGQDATREVARSGVDPAVESAVREEIARAAEDFQVDLLDETFVLRLALHVQNLLRRAEESALTRNPLTRSLKSSYPMIFEVAVSIASGLHDRLGTPIHDDEIAYIAMHVGGRLERSRKAESILTATIVCPGYYELHELLRSSVDRSLGSAIEVTSVVTNVDPDWASFDTDLVLSTIEPGAAGDRFVRIQPFLTDADVDRIQQAAARVRRARRLARLRTELARYFVAEAFVYPLPDEGEEAIIRRLGGLLADAGLIGADYIENTIARERMSSTAFTDALAVPHALQMTAARTAIALGVADGSAAWGDGRVQVVALAAFSESDRAAFQTVFEQLVEVFSERDSVQRIVRRGTTYEAFLDELVAVIDG